MKLILFFIILGIQFSWADSYQGPKEAGVERFTCGTYRLKGELSVKKIKSAKGPIYFLRVYPETTREYSVQLMGVVLEGFNALKSRINVVVEGQIEREALGSEAQFFVLNQPKLTTETKVLENTVELLKKLPCP
jgi:hypothetical protein